MNIVFEEKYPHEKGFAEHFGREIAPILTEIETSRLRYLKIYKSMLIASCAFITGACFVYYYNHPTEQNMVHRALTYLLWMAFGGYLPAALLQRYFEYTNKNKIMPRIMSFFRDISYDGKRYVPPGALRDFLIVPPFNKYSGSDFMEAPGQYISSRLRLVQKSGSGKNSRSSVMFDGLAIMIELARQVRSPVALKIDEGKIMNWLTSLGRGYERIPLVDPVFEGIFEVYGKDQVEARAILAPDVMELFLRLNFLFSNWKSDLDELEAMTARVIANHNIEEVRDNTKSGFRANFMDKNLLLLIKTPDELFEPVSLRKSCYDLTQIRAVLYQVSLIRQIHEVLKAKIY